MSTFRDLVLDTCLEARNRILNGIAADLQRNGFTDVSFENDGPAVEPLNFGKVTIDATYNGAPYQFTMSNSGMSLFVKGESLPGSSSAGILRKNLDRMNKRGSGGLRDILASEGLLPRTAASFEDAVKGKKFRNPETGNDVAFGSLPADEQKKLRGEWDKKNKGKGTEKSEGGRSEEEAEDAFSRFNAEGPQGSYGFSPEEKKRVKKMVLDGADLDQITKVVQDGEGDLPSGASAKTKKLWEYLNKVFEGK